MTRRQREATVLVVAVFLLFGGATLGHATDEGVTLKQSLIDVSLAAAIVATMCILLWAAMIWVDRGQE